MTRDDLLALALVASFALLVTSHVVLVAGLAARRPRWRAPIALVAAPLAPYWSARAGRAVWTAVWVASATAYAVLRYLAGSATPR
jgi:hypothetical protein